MANTREILGDQATLDGLVSHTLTSLEEDGVTTLATNALAKQTQLTSVKFPNLTKTGTSAFQNCEGLTTLTAENFPRLATIDTNAFANCTGLTEVELPSVTTVSNTAFSGCTNLETFETGTNKVAFTTPFASCGKLDSLIVNSTEMSTLNSSSGLSGTPIASYQGAVYVPDDLVGTYRVNANWRSYFIFSKNDYPVVDFPETANYYNESNVQLWRDVVNNYNYATDYEIGKTLPIDFGRTYGIKQMELIAFDRDDKADGSGKAKMTWMMTGSLCAHIMDTYLNSWYNCNLRNWLKTSIFRLLPEVLRDNIVEVSKTYYDANSNSTLSCADTIWIPSAREIVGESGVEDSGTDYTDRFPDSISRRRGNYWWLRSQHHIDIYSTNRVTNNYIITNNGNLSNTSGSSESQVILCFCL